MELANKSIHKTFKALHVVCTCRSENGNRRFQNKSTAMFKIVKIGVAINISLDWKLASCYSKITIQI